MPALQVIIYQTDDGRMPLLDWLDTLTDKVRAKCFVRLERLSQLGYQLRRPETAYQRKTIMIKNKKQSTTNAIEIIRHRYFNSRPEVTALLEEERLNAEVARRIYELRHRSTLTQEELAKLVGTSASVISRLEDADYQGHSLTMLRRIAVALNRRLEIRFLPMQSLARSN
ncbi:MAG: helix-turn-helix domain-containing protein [Candidatus Vogelbacteria bacterium]